MHAALLALFMLTATPYAACRKYRPFARLAFMPCCCAKGHLIETFTIPRPSRRQLFDLVDLHLRDQLFPSEMRRDHPLLVAHHERIAATPAIAKYLSSPSRQAKVNGNDLG